MVIKVVLILQSFRTSAFFVLSYWLVFPPLQFDWSINGRERHLKSINLKAMTWLIIPTLMESE